MLNKKNILSMVSLGLTIVSGAIGIVSSIVDRKVHSNDLQEEVSKEVARQMAKLAKKDKES